jgi:hypothetical protein
MRFSKAGLLAFLKDEIKKLEARNQLPLLDDPMEDDLKGRPTTYVFDTAMRIGLRTVLEAIKNDKI